ncbi:hypothetical protein BC937DRAFT_90114 [Endogone sp. FLAS-F59071]|nr:hypothetical protein BC937DRAFT_90114 [Endogone sp. FLAS-F59071]|eukprot:RUS17329.1 hypothetical protein BC937DRAFT_90114 [Endogone sp. FLAS-F59071]
METLTTNKDCDQQLQTSFPTAHRAQVPCAVLVTFADWSGDANTTPNIPVASQLWSPKISSVSPASVSVDSILDMGILEEITDASIGQPLIPLPPEPIPDDSDVDMDADNYDETLSMHDAKVSEVDSIIGNDIRSRKLQVTAKHSVRGLRLTRAIGSVGINPLRYASRNTYTAFKRILKRRIFESQDKIQRALARFDCRYPRVNVSTGSSGLDSSSRSQLPPTFGTNFVNIFDTITSRSVHRTWLANTRSLIRHVEKGADNNSENTSMPGSYVAEDGGETQKSFRDSKLDLPSINSCNSDKADTKVSRNSRSGEDSAEDSADTSRPAVQQRRELNFLDYKKPHKFDIYNMIPREFLGFIRQTESIAFQVVNGEPFVRKDTQSWVRCSDLWQRLGAAYGASLLTNSSPRIDNIAPGNPIENYQVERVALFITGHAPESPSVSYFILMAHTYGYHAHTKHTDHVYIDTARYILGWAVESWFQGWPFVVFLDATSILECEVEGLIRTLRVSCDTETMDVVVYTDKSSNMLNAGANAVLKCPKRESLAFIFQKLQARAPPQRIDFYNRGAPYYEFTNFFEAKFTVDFLEWKTSEHYFQANKFPDHPQIYHEVFYADSARTAFNLSRRYHAKRRADWESLDPSTGRPFKENIMRIGLFHKFNSNPLLKYKLLSTSRAQIFEHTTNDRFWGDGLDGSGQNRLGALLEFTRDVLFTDEILSLSMTEHLTETAAVRARWYLNDLKRGDHNQG